MVLLRVESGILLLDFASVFEINLIAHEQDYDIVVGILLQLSQPILNILKTLLRCHIIYQQSSNGSPIVSIRNCFVPFLTGSVPNLRLNSFAIGGLDGLRCKLYSYG